MEFLKDTTLLVALLIGIVLGAVIMWLCVRKVHNDQAGLLKSYAEELRGTRDENAGLKLRSRSLETAWGEGEHTIALLREDVDNCTERISKAAHVLSNSLEYAVRGRVHTGSVLSALHFLKDSLPVTPEEKADHLRKALELPDRNTDAYDEIQERSEDATRGLDPEARHR